MARELVRSARERGTALSKTVIETALVEEMADHLGYGKHDPAGWDSGDSRNGTCIKTECSARHGAWVATSVDLLTSLCSGVGTHGTKSCLGALRDWVHPAFAGSILVRFSHAVQRAMRPAMISRSGTTKCSE